MYKRGIFLLIVCLIVLSIFGFSNAQTQPITNGLNYLTSTQNTDGSWGNDTSEADILPSTFSVMETFQLLNHTTLQNYEIGLFWLQNQPLDITEYLAERIHLLLISGTDSNLLISYFNELFNAWGGYCDGYKANNYDTALALRALKKINYSDQNTMDYALNYLVGNQNSDGGWGLKQGMDSEVYYTALVSSTLQQFQRTTSIATAINKATSYLIAHQNTDGGFGSGGASPAPTSTVYGTALTYLALVGVTTDATVLGNAINYLSSTQLPNGSWDDDPYSTALALRALYLSDNNPPPPTPDNGTITGKVIDASTNQPLNGVSVSVAGIQPQAAATTDTTGSFTLPDIPAGSQTLTFTISGYATSTITVNVTAGSIINLGTITLSTSPATGIIKGTVTDASNGQPLEGIAITITGSFNGSTTTGTDGSFIFTDVTPGNVTITATKTGYYSATGTGAATAGGTLFFNPQLSTQPPPATTGNLTGKVFDGSTNTPIQAAAISISGGSSTTTDSQGIFIINDLTPETYQVTISATGYISQSYQ